MAQPLNMKHMSGDNLLIAYLDLCGTKFVYSKFDLSQQIERMCLVIKEVLEKIENAFIDDKESLYIHMYADSIVMAQRPKIKIDPLKLLKLILDIQYHLLRESELLQIHKEIKSSKQRPFYMPILIRAFIKRGKYYGLIASFEEQINNLFTNFSLVGGEAIVKMDKILEGLPMGVYIDDSIIGELMIEQYRLLDVNGQSIKFVKPPPNFDSLRQMFSSSNINLLGRENFDDWVEQLIESTGDNIEFKNILKPWCDAVQGRISIINKRALDAK